MQKRNLEIEIILPAINQKTWIEKHVQRTTKLQTGSRLFTFQRPQKQIEAPDTWVNICISIFDIQRPPDEGFRQAGADTMEEDPANVTNEIVGCREEVRWMVRLCLSLDTYPFSVNKIRKLHCTRWGSPFHTFFRNQASANVAG